MIVIGPKYGLFLFFGNRFCYDKRKLCYFLAARVKIIMVRERSTQLDFFDASSEENEPSDEDERWRLQATHGDDARHAALIKGEGVRKKQKKQQTAAGHLRAIRNAIGAPRKGDQGELSHEK